MRRFIIALAVFLPLSAFAADLPAGVGLQSAKLAANAVLPSKMSDATVLTTPEGKTLYVLASDMEFGKSACNGTCAMMWPPFTAPAEAKPLNDWTIFTRDDGSRQWAYKGKPLYTYSKDEKPGDAKGHNVLQIWTAVTTVSPTQSASK
jgi:predicted lipoprotein with Yx(FWY)xxD motif